MTDPSLIERVRSGDHAAFESVLAEHKGPIYGYLKSRVLEAADAEDMTQEVFLRFYTARAKLEPGNAIRPWLMGIARNILREHIRRCKKRRQVAWTQLCLDVEEQQPETAGPHDDALEELPACLGSLGPSAREAIDLKYRSSLQLSDIGAKLRRSEGAVKLLVFRARQALRQCLKSKLGSEHDG